jgi:hypothetical protein
MMVTFLPFAVGQNQRSIGCGALARTVVRLAATFLVGDFFAVALFGDALRAAFLPADLLPAALRPAVLRPVPFLETALRAIDRLP